MTLNGLSTSKAPMFQFAMMCSRSAWRTTATRQPAKNVDLWKELLDVTDRHQVTFIWVKGHVENPENCRCDELAVLARQAEDLAPDEGFENLMNQPECLRQMDLFEVLQ